MAFLDELLQGSAHHTVSVSANAVSVKPKGSSDTELAAFQDTVGAIVHHEGEGYTIHTSHISKDRPGDLTDLVVLRLDD
jgi:hypothetical protein